MMKASIARSCFIVVFLFSMVAVSALFADDDPLANQLVVEKQQFAPGSFLEIGVYRGQVLSLISLLAKLEQKHCDIAGISPFSSARAR